MQRYNAASCTSAVNNAAIGGASARDAARADASSLPGNISLNSRRPSHLTPYKLKCDKEALNSRLGPPDFHPQTTNCPEETLTREFVQSGYRETVEGIEEIKEISFTQVQAFTSPVVGKCKEAIRKRLRAINESRAQKRKAGQVYGVPLSGSLLTKPGVFPGQRQCGEDFRKKWIEGLSQPHKRLRFLADHVPHGYRKSSLIEVLIRNNVPLLRATWFIKVTYLNQVRPGSGTANISSGASDKNQFSCTELWTKDVIEYLQHLVDDFFLKNSSHPAVHSRDRSPQMLYTGSIQHKSDPALTVTDGEEPSLHFKWWYMVRLLQWHYAEGLLLPSYIIDWVLNQLKDKELLEILQLLLPIIYGIIKSVVLSQTYVRTLVAVAVRFIKEPSPGGSDLVDNSRRAYTTSALIELLRYLIMAVPDTFVALDCFPLPSCVLSYGVNDGSFLSKVSEDAGKTRNGQLEVASVCREKGLDAQCQSLSFSNAVSSIQRRADNLAKAASPGYPRHNVAKAVQALDKALVLGDVRGAYKFLFEDLCDGAGDESWMAEVSPCLRSSLQWIGIVSLSFVCSVFFLFEWATSDLRDFRIAPPHDLKFSGRKDYSQIYIAIRILKRKMKDMQNPIRHKNGSPLGVKNIGKGLSQPNNLSGWHSMGTVRETNNNVKSRDGKGIKLCDIFQSPGPLHDIVVCWIDQHEVHRGDGFKALQLLIMELTRSGIFYPQAYVRQLIVSGIMDKNAPLIEQDRRKRHYRVLKQLPGSYVRDALEEAQTLEVPLLSEAMQVYANERRLVLRGLLCDPYKNLNSSSIYSRKQKHHTTSVRDGSSLTSVDQWRSLQSPSNLLSGKILRSDADIEELKSAISVFLQLPNSSGSTDVGIDESQGSVKRSIGSSCNKTDLVEGTPGCEECRKVKRQKVTEERSPCHQGHSPNLSDDEDTWWVRKGPKPFESFKVDQPLKLTKQATRGRQKNVRKTHSLAQLAAARIESSQGASTSHVCDNRVSCPHHKSAMEGEAPRAMDGIRTTHCGDIVSIGKALKQLRFVERRTIAEWLITVVRRLVEETEKNAAKAGQFNRSFSPADERSSVRWKLGEEELSAILYLVDVSDDVVLATRFLLWLLPKVLSSPNSTIHGGRNMLMLPRAMESHVCEVGEAFLLSSIRRYENVLVATDLIPEALSATMQRAAAAMASNGRVSSSLAVVYAKHLLKKYGSVPTVIEWEKNFKATCDKRFLSELESGRSLDAEIGFSLGVPAGIEDLDDYFRQKISGGRLPRAGLTMREIVQRHVEDVFHYFIGKERKLFAAGLQKGPAIEKWDDGHQIAKQIIVALLDCIWQTGGAAQEGHPSLVSSAVSAIVCNVGPALAKIPDFTAGSNYSSSQSSAGSLNFARRILRIHITCLCLLKEALGERHARVFEIALAIEASSALAGVFAPVKASRTQFQPSPEAHDPNANMSSEVLNNSSKVIGRPTKIAAAVSALVIGAVVHGVTSLERMVTVLRLKEGLDVIHFVRSTRCNSNGNARSVGAFRVDNPIEVYLHWFRLLVGNCRTVSDGLIVELLGEPSIVALLRMQRTLPLMLVFPPAYSIFAFVIWRPLIINSTNIANNEDMHQLYQSFSLAIGDAIKHLPFRDVCMRDTHGFYNLIAADATDSEFAAMLEHNGPDMHTKVMVFIPLRARLFLNSIIDCKMPQTIFSHDDGNRVSGLGEPKVQSSENETKLLDKLVHVLDTLQPAKFHWQWVELRLLLNEQAVIEKLEAHDFSLVDAIRSLSPNPEKAAASENENNFIEIILTRLLVRPDAAALFSEVLHLFGRSLEDSMLLQAKWFLGGSDVLFGRKSIRQRLINIAESKGFSMKAQISKPWGWSYSRIDPSMTRGDKRKFEATSLEEGEVVEEGMDLKKHGKGSSQASDTEGVNVIQQHVTQRALIELVLPCIDQSSDDSRNTFANDLIKQMNNIEQQITNVTRGANKQAGTVPSGIEGPANKSNNRKAMRGGSPGLARRPTGAADSAPPSPTALRASMSLRLQFLLRLLPVICADGEPTGRNMRHMFVSVILRLLGSRVVHEDADPPFYAHQRFLAKKEVDSSMEASASIASVDLCGDSLFDRLLLVLHGLLSSCQPSWLKLKSASKPTNESAKDFPGFDREAAESLQNELDRMELPGMIRWRIQAAMPVLLAPGRCCVSCHPPSVPTAALASLQPSISVPGFHSGNLSPLHRNTFPPRTANLPGKSKTFLSQHDHNMEIDPWTLLEDGAGSGTSSSNTAVIGSSDHANLRASSWLKGAIRVRRADLTYIGAVDDDN
ncbi:mediator of RNA polymerase II transcription subunit 12 [Malania oleifera]|uniref:mediator of RNA polymerase II transcription subunit 12 n=1 Tax=Malania oleifera TaxID=397392 RepID=UPI0025AE01BD|nr:mediator of RNA polymerase II transcription subunit 12 [Malania oleifera]XP_057980762.1 mediator of RNA polymerase II transcription subunit 12 [Malania oleifera]XP_057980763.1 mediator of RNA polymerase II transcription subunit 12 [Malania oleifera]XP_057980764.1 mediator of RNA polymerase II transcription subunit 12 [Malania oleifera]XP_057980765.1 mediator of RNA polymerase II transcription subunit 12 [Malania oleifera]XP_057980766.1 mediator of RNA polymerase II transcription subunit 12 